MENHQQLWERCLQLIRQKVEERVYDVWFATVECESYDAQQNTVVLSVPSTYVYEYLEQYQVPLLSWALSACFAPGVRLNYRIRREPVRQQPAVEIPSVPQCPRFTIPDARERIEKGLQHFLGDDARWLPAYDRVAEWLSDNKGRGLLCVGSSGLGKTLVCEHILPVILGRQIRTVTAREMNSQIDELLRERCVIIDDLGKEAVEVKNYGNVRRPFFELCDAAERNGILLIITTNLSTTTVNDARYPASIEARYGKEVLSRLRATTRVVIFEGEDMRS